MKIRHFAALLIALLTLSLLAGCSARAVTHSLEKAEEKIEHKLDAAEDAVERSLRDLAAPPTTKSPEPRPSLPQEAAPAAPEAAVRLTPEEAEAFALDHAGFTTGQVKALRAEFEIDDRIPHYDIEFREGHWEYEYEIHAETGAVLSFEKDD